MFKSKIRPRPWKPSSAMAAVATCSLLVTLLSSSSSSSSNSPSFLVHAWQQPILPKSPARGVGIPTSSTARQYAVETEIVAATAATTAPKGAMMMNKLRRRKLVRRKMSVTQHAASSSVLKQQPRGESSSLQEKTTFLTHEEEVLYAHQIRTLRAAIRQRDEMAASSASAAPQVSEAEWAAACGTTPRQLRAWMAAGRAAREQLVSANVGLVTSIAKKHFYGRLQHAAGSGGSSILTLHDLCQEGNLGLLTAAERFEPERGLRFSTYAVYWIRQRISRCINDTARTIRLPAHVHGTLTKMTRLRLQYYRQHGREMTLPALATAMDMPLHKVAKLTQSAQSCVSLQMPLKARPEDTRTLADALPSSGPTPEEACESSMLQQDVQTMLHKVLTEQERAVVALRYGLQQRQMDTASSSNSATAADADASPSTAGLTVAATARATGLSPDAVRVTEARALNKLRQGGQLQDYIVGSSTSSKSRSSPNNRAASKKKIWESPSLWDTTTTGTTSNNHKTIKRPTSLTQRSKRTTTTASEEEASSNNSKDRLWFF